VNKQSHGTLALARRRAAGALALFGLGCGGALAPGQDAGTDATVTSDGRAPTDVSPHADGALPPLDDVAAQDVAPRRVGACNGLAAPGTWERITPPAVAAQLPPRGPGGPDGCVYGVHSFVADPSNPAVVYLGTCQMGIWKTTDCGATWARVNTGRNGAEVESGRQWTFAIDPVDPQVLYTNSGYGRTSGAWRSTNGGVDWDPFWPPADPALASLVDYSFVAQVVMDPTDHRHLLLSWHGVCHAPHPAVCIAETTDAGATWRIIDGRPEWSGGEGQFVYFLTDRRTWLWGSQTNGLWRTTDGGTSWTVIDRTIVGHGAGQLYRSRSGVFYLGGTSGVIRSPDGVTWSVVPHSGNLIAGITVSGTQLFAGRSFPWGPSGSTPFLPYWTSLESDGQTWTQMSSPMMTDGALQLAYDPDHHLLYSANYHEGFWRVVVP
jgi:hypothetical protein